MTESSVPSMDGSAGSDARVLLSRVPFAHTGSFEDPQRAATGTDFAWLVEHYSLEAARVWLLVMP